MAAGQLCRLLEVPAFAEHEVGEKIEDRAEDKICELAAKNDFKAAAKWQDEANQVVRLMIESDNWSYRKAMMKLVGIDVGPYRAPFEPLTAGQEESFLARVRALGIVGMVK